MGLNSYEFVETRRTTKASCAMTQCSCEGYLDEKKRLHITVLLTELIACGVLQVSREKLEVTRWDQTFDGCQIYHDKEKESEGRKC